MTPKTPKLTDKQWRDALYAAGIGGPHWNKRLSLTFPNAVEQATSNWYKEGRHTILVSNNRESALVFAGTTLARKAAVQGISLGTLIRALKNNDHARLEKLRSSDVVCLIGFCEQTFKHRPFNEEVQLDVEEFVMDLIYGKGMSFIFDVTDASMPWYSTSFVSRITENADVVQ